MQQVAMLLEFPRCHLSKSHHTASSLSLICMKSKLIVSHYPRPLKQKVPGTDDKGPLFQTLQTAQLVHQIVIIIAFVLVILEQAT